MESWIRGCNFKFNFKSTFIVDWGASCPQSINSCVTAPWVSSSTPKFIGAGSSCLLGGYCAELALLRPFVRT